MRFRFIVSVSFIQGWCDSSSQSKFPADPFTQKVSSIAKRH